MSETRMEKADSLSRRLDWKVGVENDNENQNLIKKEYVREIIEIVVECYELKSLGSDNRTTLVLSNTRKLNRDLFTK